MPYPNHRGHEAVREGERLALLAGVLVIVLVIGALYGIGYVVTQVW